MSYRALALVAVLAMAPGRAQQPQPARPTETVLRSTVQEVLLDFIARDKHQKLVTDLHPEEVEIFEDGVRQQVRSFQYRAGRGAPEKPAESAEAGSAGGRSTSSPAYNPLREINVVTLVLEAMSPLTRKQATLAAKDFLGSELRPSTYVAVFTLNHRLALLQQYTNNLSLLNQAVDRASSGAYQTFAKDMEKEVAILNSLAGPERFSPMRPGDAEEGGPVVAQSRLDAAAAQIQRHIAAVTLDILTSQVGNQSIDALHQLIHAQAQLPGRKTIVYFSEGLILPPEQPERFRTVISDANRANIAFYTVDATGLDTMSRVRESSIIGDAIGSVGAPNPGARALPVNFQENLRQLAEDTGGFAISNTNDMTVPLRRVMEEVRTHYEAAYAPASTNYDGHFRTIEVRTTRPGLRIQNRKGYFALPLLNGQTLAPFEFAALTALNTLPAPHAFEFHAGTLSFHTTAQATECRAVFSVPSGVLTFTEDAQKKLFRIHVAFLGLIKDEQDQIVRKLSRDLVFQAPGGKRAEFERGEATVTLPLNLAPGRYHMDAVAADLEGQKASTLRIAFFVPSAEAGSAEGRLGLSDLVFVRSVQASAGDRDAADPLEAAGGRITPDLTPAIAQSPAAVEGVYFVLYPSPGPAAKPDVRITVSHDGKAINQGQPSLPAAESDGSIRVLSQIGLGGLDAGAYEIRVTAAQGGATVGRSAVIAIR